MFCCHLFVKGDSGESVDGHMHPIVSFVDLEMPLRSGIFPYVQPCNHSDHKMDSNR